MMISRTNSDRGWAWGLTYAFPPLVAQLVAASARAGGPGEFRIDGIGPPDPAATQRNNDDRAFQGILDAMDLPETVGAMRQRLSPLVAAYPDRAKGLEIAFDTIDVDLLESLEYPHLLLTPGPVHTFAFPRSDASALPGSQVDSLHEARRGFALAYLAMLNHPTGVGDRWLSEVARDLAFVDGYTRAIAQPNAEAAPIRRRAAEHAAETVRRYEGLLYDLPATIRPNGSIDEHRHRLSVLDGVIEYGESLSPRAAKLWRDDNAPLAASLGSAPDAVTLDQVIALQEASSGTAARLRRVFSPQTPRPISPDGDTKKFFPNRFEPPQR